MPNVYKEIIRGASYYKQTQAAGDLEFVKKHGFMCCGSGDDHRLTAEERKLVEEHDPADGDLELPAGPLNSR